MIQDQIAESPWGKVTSRGTIAPGIVFANTEGHGGLWLSVARVEQFRHKLPEFRPFAGWPWLEEDADAAAACLVWPECYGPEAIRNACRMYVQADHLPNAKSVQSFLVATPDGRALLKIADQWEKDNADKWEAGSSCTKYGGWLVWLHQVKDRSQVARWFKDYPRQTIYTQDELKRQSLSEQDAHARELAAEVRRQSINIMAHRGL